jgi:hypothetical protein
MSGESKILPLVAIVVSVVACLPTACCLAFYGLGSLATLLVDPRMIEDAAGAGPVPSRLTFATIGGGSACIALVALGLGVFGLVWGIRALRRASAA